MKRIFSSDEVDLDTQLRSMRERPRPEFVHDLAGRLPRERQTARALRVAFAAVLSAGMLTAMAALGGFAYATHKPGHPPPPTPAQAQYGKKCGTTPATTQPGRGTSPGTKPAPGQPGATCPGVSGPKPG